MMHSPLSSLGPGAHKFMKAPEASSALLAMQARGLELPRQHADSISPSSNGGHDSTHGVSPLSILSTPSNLEKPLPGLSTDRLFKRPKSTASVETTVTGILDLYTNLSEQSLASEYEEMTVSSNASDHEYTLPTSVVHQPKAYRDTIAPLLEHQFSSERLTVPSAPSPMSIASMPRLRHPNASSSSVPSLRLTPEASPNVKLFAQDLAELSQSSIQITPEMTPPLPPSPDPAAAPSFQSYAHELQERKIALQVPDVRDADSWYDHPLSPVSPEEVMPSLRDSQYSAVSPEEGLGHQRTQMYDALIAPTSPLQIGGDESVVNYVQSDFLPGPLAATLTEVVDNKMMVPPLDLTRSPSISKISEGSAPVHQAEINPEQEVVPKSQHASLITQDQPECLESASHSKKSSLAVQDPIEGPLRGYLTTPPPGRTTESAISKVMGRPNLAEIYRPGSAFSTDSSLERDAKDRIGGHFKAALRFGKKRRDKSKGSKDSNEKQKKTKSGPVFGMTLPSRNDSSVDFVDDLDSYKFPYWKSHASAPHPSTTNISRITSPDRSVFRRDESRQRPSSAASGPGPAVERSPQPTPVHDVTGADSIDRPPISPPARRREPQAAIPLTEYQKYGPAAWDEKKKKQRLKREEKAAKEAAKAAEKEAKRRARAQGNAATTADQDLNRFLDERIAISRDVGKAYSGSRPIGMRTQSQTISRSAERVDVRPSSDVLNVASSRQSRTGGSARAVYNNDLFEASGGGKKKGGYMNRFIMSSEEKRRMKVKQSITVVGGTRLDL